MSETVAVALSRPFPGLRPYRESESEFFFGQDNQIEKLLDRLGSTRFLAVVGDSGCGKSSLVHAGLIPQLRSADRNPPRWYVAKLQPGNRPLENLVSALRKVFPDVPAEAYLRGSSRGVIETVAAAGVAPDQRVLIVVDQFEEIFRYRRENANLKREDDAAHFVRLLLEAADDPAASIYVVITMRSDFIGDCALFYDLAEKVNDGLYLVPKMRRRHLREVIEMPVAAAEAAINPGLVERLLSEAEERQDGLPLLQHALMRIWQHWLRRHRPDLPIGPEDFEIERPEDDSRPFLDCHLDQHLNSIYGELTDAEKSR